MKFERCHWISVEPSWLVPRWFNGNAQISKLRAWFFFYGSLFLLTEPKFHSRLTLSSNNSRSKPHTPNKFHIFGIVRTSAFRWTYPGFFSLSKFRGTSVLWEKAFFCIFAWPHRENFQNIYNRTILKFDALHIAHIEADVPLFSKHLWKLAIRLKLWVLAHSEVSWSRTMTAKMSVFRPLFWRKSLFWPILTQKCFKCYTWLESYGSPLYDDRKKKKN